MLKSMRKHTKVIIWAVIVAFIGWGGFAVGTQFKTQGRAAGKVFGKDVSFQEYNLFYKAAQVFGYSDQPERDPEVLRQQTWRNIILSKEAKRRKIDVRDQEVRGEVLRLLSAQKIENPSPDLYRRWLQTTIGETPQNFEKQIREILRIQKLVRQVDQPVIAIPSDKEIIEAFTEDETLLNIEWLPFPTEEEAEKFLLANGTKESWQKAMTTTGKEPTASGKVSLSYLRRGWDISDEDMSKLKTARQDEILGPLHLVGQFAVVRVTEKQDADMTKLTAEQKDQIKSKILESKKYSHFIEWNRNLYLTAKLEDYLPRAEPDLS